MAASSRATGSSRASLPSFSLLPGETLLSSGAPPSSAVAMLDVSAALVTLLSFFVLLPALPFWLWANRAWMRRHRYWLTDGRLVVQTGIIGQTVRSVPLSRVADVAVVQSWWDRLFGVQHLVVRDMTGEVAKGGVATGFRLFAVEDAEGWAARILERAGPNSAADGPVSEGKESLAELRRIAALLQELRDAA